MPQPLDPDWYRIDELERHIVSFDSFHGLLKVCQVQFHRDGLFVHFPYHPSVNGMLARCELDPGPDAQSVSFAESGRLVSSRVKYSHPGDGNAHFSQDGRIRTEVRNRALAIAEPGVKGHIFSIEVQGLQQFSAMEEDRYYGGEYGRVMFQSLDGDPPESVHITGFWTQPGPDAIRKLRNPIPVRTAGVVEEKLALSPPPDSPLYGGLLLVDAVAREPLRAPHGHRLIFSGGFSPELNDLDAPGGFLLMEYPADELSDFPSIDYRATSG